METSQDAADRQAIETVLDTYLEAVRTGERSLWWQVFHPQASVVNNSGGTADLEVWPIDNFIERVESLRARVGIVEETARHVTIDLARHVASARLDFSLRLGDEWYRGTDFFSLAVPATSGSSRTSTTTATGRSSLGLSAKEPAPALDTGPRETLAPLRTIA